MTNISYKATVSNGFATVVFLDKNTVGLGIAKLLKHTPAELVQKVTYPTASYVVPEGNAKEAGFTPEVDNNNENVVETDLDDSAPRRRGRPPKHEVA